MRNAPLLASIPGYKETIAYAVRFQFGKAPLSSLQAIFALSLGYLLVIFVLQRVLRNSPPRKLNFLVVTHNLLLSVTSLVLLIAILRMIIPIVMKRGIFFAICNKSMVLDNYLNFLYYVNYLMKIWELADTVFLIFRKKKLEFLHVYHHTCTMLLTYNQISGKTAVQWVPITINLLVHVIMYYYYAKAAMGVNIWWKKYLTSLQIIQFLIDICFIYYCMYFVLSGRQCQGHLSAGYFGCFLITSYLFLFIKFYFDTYRLKTKKSKGKRD